MELRWRKCQEQFYRISISEIEGANRGHKNLKPTIKPKLGSCEIKSNRIYRVQNREQILMTVNSEKSICIMLNFLFSLLGQETTVSLEDDWYGHNRKVNNSCDEQLSLVHAWLTRTFESTSSPKLDSII